MPSSRPITVIPSEVINRPVQGLGQVAASHDSRVLDDEPWPGVPGAILQVLRCAMEKRRAQELPAAPGLHLEARLAVFKDSRCAWEPLLMRCGAAEVGVQMMKLNPAKARVTRSRCGTTIAPALCTSLQLPRSDGSFPASPW